MAVVTIDREEALNALDVATLTELRDRLREVGGDSNVRAAVLTRAGEKAFAAGADIVELSGPCRGCYQASSYVLIVTDEMVSG